MITVHLRDGTWAGYRATGSRTTEGQVWSTPSRCRRRTGRPWRGSARAGCSRRSSPRTAGCPAAGCSSGRGTTPPT
ncbi:hypothetical protein [Ornithinimicrobium kibberense]|uniref:hypothetical protein n=1 Tax=Ornithinimicrobium kibberense TaxID=282060 RepID=UPI0036177BC6